MEFEQGDFEGGEDAEAESSSARWIEDARNLPDFTADDEAVIDRIWGWIRESQCLRTSKDCANTACEQAALISLTTS